MPMKNPPHPGDFIRTEIVRSAGLSVTAAAVCADGFKARLVLLNGKADLSGDMALRIEKAFGVKMDTLMRMQSAYDIAQTRLRERQIRVRPISNLLLKRFKALMKKYRGKVSFTGSDEGTYERAHRQANTLLDAGFHSGGNRVSRDEGTSDNNEGGAETPRPHTKPSYAAGIIFFIRSFISCGDTSSTCVAMPHRCPNGS
jgi:addiction module HigA family antidote